MKKSALSQKGNTIVIALVVIVVIVVAALAWMQLNKQKVEENEGLPPVEERTNPEPLSANSLYVSSANAGSKLTVNEVTLASDGYVYIYKETSGKRTLIGKSALLKSGSQSNLVVNLTSSVKDGDVVYVALMSKDGKPVNDENENAIEMLLNVGTLMNHYDNEY